MKILSNKEYDKLINDEIPINPSIEYYLNNPYQARKIEKLEDYNIELEIKIDKKDKKIERLNNIIIKLEEYLIEAKENVKEVSFDGSSGLQMALDKLQELKGSIKSE